MRPRPLPNRVDPFGALFASPARGEMFGNRGGRFHRDGDAPLGSRRHASRQWICCELRFKDRRRTIWQGGYTELFFLDEVTALAAGHRPCFECRRAEALAFAGFWQRAKGMSERPRADEMDRTLHAERLEGRARRRHIALVERLPDGAMIAEGAQAFALRGREMLPWSAQGYGDARTRPSCGSVVLLTPPAIVAVLRQGYQPRWHGGAAAPVTPARR